MVYVFFVPLIVLVVLFFVLTKAIKNKKKRLKAFHFGKTEFDIELPLDTNAYRHADGYALPALTQNTDVENFTTLIVPYLGSLPGKKRDAIKKHVDALSGDLKMHKEIYRFFMHEYERFEGLSDTDASNKWRGKV